MGGVADCSEDCKCRRSGAGDIARFGETGWQDMHTMYDLEASGEKRGPFLARFSLCVFPNSGLQGFLDTRRANLAKTSSFWIHIGDILPQRGCFPSEAPFGIHQAKILLRMSAWESFRRIFCHRRHAENASLRYPAPVETWRTDHCEILPPLDTSEHALMK